MCDFITQTSTLPFLEQFSNTVVVDSAKWYLGAHRGTWWKRKYPQIKTGKKPSEKLHYQVWMQLTELHFLFSDQFAKKAFWKSAIRYILVQWSSRCKGNVLRWKLEGSFPRNFLVMCEFNSQSYTYVSWSSPLALSLRNLRRATLDCNEAYAHKGNIISSKRERNFLRNFFLIGEFISQTYNLDFRK